MTTINQINGIPLHYARTPQHPYGTIGRQRNFSIEDTFHEALKACFTELFETCPLGIPNAITCAGIQVNKPGQHGQGRAFDLDAIFWEDYTLITRNFHQDKILYLGIESYLRKHFGIVLNYFYNNDHKDHWHVDNSHRLPFNTNSRSKVLYLQLTLNYIYDIPILIDGFWGPQTAGAVAEVFHLLDIEGEISTAEHWMEYLDMTGRVAFQLFEQEKTPLTLMNNLFAMLNTTNFSDKNRLLESLNSFRYHEKTENWLDSFSTEKNLPKVIEKVRLVVV